MDIQDLYLPHTIANVVSGTLCTVTAALADRPWWAVIGLAVTFGAVAFMVIAGELGLRERRSPVACWRSRRAEVPESFGSASSSTSESRSIR